MIIETPTKIQVSGNPSSIDKTIVQGLIGYLSRTVEQLESAKTGIINIQLKHGMTTPYSNGVIQGLESAINLLNKDIERLNKSV